MASKQPVSRNNKRSRVTKTIPEKVKPETVSLRLRLGGNIVYKSRGKVTGKDYIWYGSSVVSVDAADAEYYLSKKQGNSCCSGNKGQNLFEIAGE